MIDNTNPTRVDREKYIEGFRKHKFEISGYYFESDLDDCLVRNGLRKGKARIPDIALRGTYSKLELPDYTEGFDALYRVTVKSGGFEVAEWKNEV